MCEAEIVWRVVVRVKKENGIVLEREEMFIDSSPARALTCAQELTLAREGGRLDGAWCYFYADVS